MAENMVAAAENMVAVAFALPLVALVVVAVVGSFMALALLKAAL